MTNPCPGLDEALLLFAHGELGFWKSLRVRLHARSCNDCRLRLERYTKLSGALSLALASTSGPRVFGPIAMKGLLGKGALLAVFFLIVGGSIWSIYQGANADRAPAPAAMGGPQTTCEAPVLKPKPVLAVKKHACTKPSLVKAATD
jgi:hypothetical protein